MNKFKAIAKPSVRRLASAVVIIICGVALRLTGYEIGLPYFLVKYGGSVLWGMMVFLAVGAALYRQSLPLITLAAASIAILTEFSRLYHTPWLDAFRLTLAGALILGRIFAWANILAYLCGIGLAVLIERWLLSRNR